MIRLSLLAGFGLALLGATLPCGARAQTQPSRSRLNGTLLLERCTSTSRPLLEGCEAYITGVRDTVSVYEDAAKAAKLTQAANRICIPAEATAPKIRDTVVAWLRAHEADRERPAGAIVVHVMRETWPCK